MQAAAIILKLNFNRCMWFMGLRFNQIHLDGPAAAEPTRFPVQCRSFFSIEPKHNQFTSAAKPELNRGQNQPGRNQSLHRLPAAFIKRLTAVHLLTFVTSTDLNTTQANLQIPSELIYLTSAQITLRFVFSTKPKNLILYQPWLKNCRVFEGYLHKHFVFLLFYLLFINLDFQK